MSEEFQLNEDQKRVAEYNGEKPLFIDAGPGSGKTRVLIERVKYLVNKKGVDPETLLIITFSNKSANELIKRLMDKNTGLSIEDVNKMHISTIHSFCFTLLIDNGFSYEVLDEDERNLMYIYKNLKYLGFADEKFFKKRHTSVLVKKFNEFTRFKVNIDKFEKYVQDNFLVSEEYIDFIKKTQEEKQETYYFPEKEVNDNKDFKESWYNGRYNNIANAYRIYLKFLEREGFIDYSLLQSKALNLLNKNPNLLNSLKYKNILIDEFQDTDPIQMKIFSKLWENSNSLAVVGDVDQSIYGFRGANVIFFNEFLENFDAELIKLRTNYRSTENIIDFSENFIKNDRSSFSKKHLHSYQKNKGPDQSVYYAISDDKTSEAIKMSKLIKYLKESGKIANYSDVGILTRSIKGKIHELTKSLKDENIPFDAVGNKNLSDQDEIKSILLLIYYLIENNEKPYIRNQWERDWLNLRGFASESFNSVKMLKLSEKTREILLKIYEEYENEVIQVEKEVYKEMTGKSSRISTFEGVFKRDEEILIEIFNKVKKPLISQFSVKDLINLGVEDEYDLKFFSKLYELKNKIIKEKNNSDLKYYKMTTLLEIYYKLLAITGYLEIDFLEDENNIKELFNLSILSNTIYKIEQVITRSSVETLFWYLYHNLSNYSSVSVDSGDEVQIMTAHASKGLEFPVVIVYGLEKDKFPMKFKDDEYSLTGSFGLPLFPTPFKFYGYEQETDLDKKEKNYSLEERRILYVAMTRAEDILILSQRKNRQEELPEIEGIDFDSIPLILDDYSILPKTQLKLKENENEIKEKELELKELELSYTSIQNYILCPFKYYLKSKFNFKEDDNIYIKKGNITHQLLHKIHKASKKEGDTEKVIEYTPEIVKERNSKEFKNVVKYHDTFLKNIKILDSELEFRLEVEVNNEKYVIIGQIDLIYERNGKIGIMDFKTTSKSDEEDDKKQLYIYLTALKENPRYNDKKIEELAIYLINSHEIKYYDIDEEYIKNYSKKINEIANNIKNKQFQKNRGKHCKTCTFIFICENELEDIDIDVYNNGNELEDINIDNYNSEKDLIDAGFSVSDGGNKDIEDSINVNNNMDVVIEVDTPDYEGYEDIGGKYNIPHFNEVIPTSSSSSSITEAIQEILSNEHPIHLTRLSKLLLTFLNQKTLNKTIRNQIIHEIKEKELGTIYGDFVYLDLKSNTTLNTNLSIIPKIPNNRHIEHISKKELMEGMFIVADRFFGLKKETLYHKTGRLFGFNLLGNKISKFLDEAFEELININRISFENGIINTYSLKNYEEDIHEIERIYNGKKKISHEIIENYFYSPQNRHDKFINEFNSLNDAFLRENKSALNFITMAQGNTKDVVDEIKERINTIKSHTKKIEDFTLELETIQKYELIINSLIRKYRDKEDIAKEIIKKFFLQQISHDRFIKELNSLSDSFIKETNSALNSINLANEHGRIEDEFKNRIDVIKSYMGKIEDFILEIETIQKYENTIHDLNEKYEEKELIARKIIKECFSPPQITYDRFVGEINRSNEVFTKQKELALNIIQIDLKLKQQVQNELKKRIDALKSLVDKINELIFELKINSNNSSEMSDEDEVKYLLDDMEKLVNSIKDYD
jgi:DNA helicase-2/ATP-dependent DNA helicase PcrA